MPDGLNVNDGEFSLSDFSSGEPQKKERVYGCSREEVCLLHIEFYYLWSTSLLFMPMVILNERHFEYPNMIVKWCNLLVVHISGLNVHDSLVHVILRENKKHCFMFFYIQNHESKCEFWSSIPSLSTGWRHAPMRTVNYAEKSRHLSAPTSTFILQSHISSVSLSINNCPYTFHTLLTSPDVVSDYNIQ